MTRPSTAVRGPTPGPVFLWLLAGLTVAAVALAVWDIVDDDTDERTDAGVSLEEIVDDPEDHLGWTVTVQGEAGSPTIVRSEDEAGREIARTAAFSLTGDEADEQILVLANAVQAPFVEAGDTVQVTGSVRPFDETRLAVLAGETLEVDDELIERWRGRPVLVAAFVDPTLPADVS